MQFPKVELLTDEKRSYSAGGLDEKPMLLASHQAARQAVACQPTRSRYLETLATFRPFLPPPSPPFPTSSNVARPRWATERNMPMQHSSISTTPEVVDGGSVAYKKKNKGSTAKDVDIQSTNELLDYQSDAVKLSFPKLRKAVGQVSSKHPELEEAQLNTLGLLEVIMTYSSGKRKYTSREVAGIHERMIADRQIELWLIGDRKKVTIKTDGSTQSYAKVLKDAYKRSDEGTLRQEGYYAVQWQLKTSRNTAASSSSLPTPHSEKGGRDEIDLRSLVRNLWLSLSLKASANASMPAVRKIREVGHSPSPEPVLLPEDDHFAQATWLRRGTDALQPTAPAWAQCDPMEVSTTWPGNEGGSAASAMSTMHALRSRSGNPRTHHSKALRRLYLLAHRQSASEVVPLVSRSDSDSASVSQAKEKRKQTSQTAESHRMASHLQKNRMAHIIHDMLHRGDVGASANAIRSGLYQWDREVQQRRAMQKSIIKNFETGRTAPLTPEQAKDVNLSESVDDLVPTWLLLSALKMCIQRGHPKEVEGLVKTYLESLKSRHGVEQDNDLSRLLPYNAKTYSVTKPQVPPNGTSLLNSMLRAHLVTTKDDSFEQMMHVLEKWTVNGQGIVEWCAKAKGQSQLPPPRSSQCLEDTMACLHPDEDSILIMLESLRRRKVRFEMGLRIVNECFGRWGIHHDQEREDIMVGFGQPKLFRLTSTRVPRKMLGWAVEWKPKTEKAKEERIDYVERVLTAWRSWKSLSKDGLTSEVKKRDKGAAVPQRQTQERWLWSAMLGRLNKHGLLRRKKAYTPIANYC